VNDVWFLTSHGSAVISPAEGLLTPQAAHGRQCGINTFSFRLCAFTFYSTAGLLRPQFGIIAETSI
jgi:hypothetical protein